MNMTKKIQHRSFAEVENVDYELPPVNLLKLPNHTDQSGEYELDSRKCCDT